ncbi:MFS transporter [Scandinavium goeteborgense]|uniref:Inositol transporter-like SP family MFS transporter n=1 Tax=Scandinavium goeteborgense TaxID=1851514 RepID=A0A4R6ENC4_SCAGO|nr:MFS transporter [Scandinavium goeteborgense]TDN60695.1 inositol transporter-like SP family MFS transporter [Scandinavium goeteborgense]
MLNIKQPNPWYVGVVSGMASYIDSAAIVSNGTALVIYQKAIGTTSTEIGILSGVLTLCIALGAFTGGRLGDCYGRRNVFIITMMMVFIGTLLLAFSGGFYLLLLGTVLVGLATGADLPVSLATISEAASDKNRGKIIGLSNLLWFAGICTTMAISALVGGWGRSGAQILYLHVGTVAFILLVLRWSLPESPMWLTAHNERKAGRSTVRAQKTSIGDLLRGKYLWPFIALCLFYMFTNLAANTGGQFGAYVAVNVVGITVEKNALWNLIAMPVGVLSGLLFMKMVDTQKRMVVYIIGAFFFAGGFFTPVLLHFSPVSWLCCLLFTAIGSGMAFEGIMKVWSQESFPTMLRATAQGAIVGVARLTCGILAFVTPVLLDAGPIVLYTLLSGLVASGMFIGWLCFHGKQRNEFSSEAEIIALATHRPLPAAAQTTTPN